VVARFGSAASQLSLAFWTERRRCMQRQHACGSTDSEHYCHQMRVLVGPIRWTSERTVSSRTNLWVHALDPPSHVVTPSPRTFLRAKLRRGRKKYGIWSTYI
jgi:hypothetical protein